MTEPLFLKDAYLREAPGRVVGLSDDGIVLDGSIFYAQGGGQPGDSGWISWDGQEIAVTNAIKGEAGAIMLLSDPDAPKPPMGATVLQRLNWERRHRHMRVHTGLHLLSVVIPLPVSGGAITDIKGRLDFDMPEAPEDKEAVEKALKALVEGDHKVTDEWITDDELAARPEMVKTMSVKPPVGQGRVRLVRIGGAEAVDLQPCGGTHVRSTAEIGNVRLGKIEKKGKQNRRVHMLID